MTIDIVERLAHFEEHEREQGDMYGAEVLYRAAEEIKRLRIELSTLRQECHDLNKESR